jgi:hypothetical protein
MLRSLVGRGAVAVAALIVPASVAGAAADDTEPGEPSTPTSQAATSEDGTSVSATSVEGGDSPPGPPPGDIDFQVDMMLGLVPEDEMNDYWSEQSQRQQVRIQECMNEAGFEYNLENTDDMVFIDPLAELTPLEYAEQWGFGTYTTMDPETSPYNDIDQEYVWPNEEIVNSLSAAEQNAWFEVNNRCSNEAYTEEDPYRNPMVQQALEDFFTEVESDPRMAWRVCMEEAGQPFANPEDMYEEMFDDDTINEFYETEAWEPDSENHAEWQRLVEREIAVAVANANCAPALDETREEVTADLRPALVEVWQTIDWSLPPVTFPGDGEMIFGDDGMIVEGSLPPDASGPVGTDDAPVAIDLSEPSGSEPATTAP